MKSHEIDYRWLTEHPFERFKLYRGRWVAVVDGTIVASGNNGAQVYEEARRAYPDQDILLDVVEPELTNPEYGSSPLA